MGLPNLCIGLRGDIKNTEEIFGKYKDSIFEVYIAAPPEIMGTGRYSNIPATMENLKEQSEMAHKNGANVNILLNSTCDSGKEFTEEFEKNLKGFLYYIQYAVKADAVTAALPRIIEIISDYRKENGYSVDIVNSTYSDILTIEEAKQYEALGVDRIMPSQHMNRNFPFLRKLRKELNGATKIELLANTGCIYNCIWRHEHPNFTTHFSKDRKSGADPFIEKCRLKRMNPLNSISTPFIRPEDAHFYEELGIKYFKISSRTASTKWTMNVIDAYLNRSYDENIIELCTSLDISKHAFIDNKKLDGLLQFVCEKPEDYLKLCKEFYTKIVEA